MSPLPFRSLKEVRDHIAVLLTNLPGPVHTELPDKTTTPATYVTPGDPYVDDEGCNFGDFNVRLTVVLVAGKGTNSKVTDQLDQMIEDALVALYDAGVANYVGRPGQITLNGQAYTAVAIDVAVRLRLTE